MIVDELITDRTQAEVARLRELLLIGWANMTEAQKAEYAASRGEYRPSDLNRVSEAEEYIADEFNDFIGDLSVAYTTAIADILGSLEYPTKYYDIPTPVIPTSYGDAEYSSVTIYPVKTNWTYTDIQQGVTDISYYLANVRLLRGLLPLTAPTTPSTLDGLTFEGANAIEQILLATHNALMAHITVKNNALQAKKNEDKEKYRLASVPWIQSAEFAAGEITM